MERRPRHRYRSTASNNNDRSCHSAETAGGSSKQRISFTIHRYAVRMAPNAIRQL
jgi:hypothetical protein